MLLLLLLLRTSISRAVPTRMKHGSFLPTWYFFCVTALKVLVITPLWFMKRIILVRLEESYEWSPSICDAGKQCS